MFSLFTSSFAALLEMCEFPEVTPVLKENRVTAGAAAAPRGLFYSAACSLFDFSVLRTERTEV